MSLPPGPRLPRTLQAVGWAQRTLPWLERCRERYGDAFTLRIRHWGDWVVLADEADVKAVFTAGFFDLMIDATCRAEDELMARLAAGEEGASALSRRGDEQTQTHHHGSAS